MSTANSEKWVALPDAADRTDGQIVVGHTGLPAGLEPAQLQVNTTALRRGVIDWGGYSGLTLGCYHGGQDQFAVSAGIDSDGNAYGMGSATVTKAEISQFRPASDDYLNAIDVRNGTLGVQWNIDALDGQLELHERYVPIIRARQLNQAVRAAVLKGIFEHNTTEVVQNRDAAQTSTNIVFDSIGMAFILDPLIQKDYPRATAQLLARVGLMGILRRARYRRPDGMKPSEDITDPLLFTVRSTRALIGACAVAPAKLIRPTPSK